MTNAIRAILAVTAGVLLMPSLAAAQIPGFDSTIAKTQESLGQDHFRLTGDVVLSQPGSKFYADLVDYYPQTNRVLAAGNVLIQAADHQIAADRADFNAVTGLGTFYNARGFAALGARADVSQFGTLQPDVQFYGETIEKTGPQTYVILHGGFTTCAQANPRWEMTSGNIRLHVDHYALLRNMWLKAKGVPVLFLPALYYPISSNARQTGFMMPSYGASSYRGQVISNGFFWALGRSQDATILHDWYSKTGQAVSTEYRYVSLRGNGNINDIFTNEKDTTFTNPDGSEQFRQGVKSFTLNGSLSQGLAGSWYAQARAMYFSSIDAHQRSTNDLTQTSQRNRTFGGSLSGSMLGNRITATYDRNEAFTGLAFSSIRGSAPRLNVARPDRLLGPLPVYGGVSTEVLHLVQGTRDTSSGTLVSTKGDIDRVDIQPVIRFPYNKLTFLALNSSLMWRNTFWSDSLDPATNARLTAPIARQFLEMTANVTGPTFVKIWDAPNSRYAQRFKNSIEPFLQITHRTAIDNTAQIVKSESADSIVGNATSYGYGANTRIYAKRTTDGQLSAAREIISARIGQTYNTNADWIKSDQQYTGSGKLTPNSHFSPVQMQVHASPTTAVNANFRAEFDGRWHKFQTFGADGSWNSNRVSFLAGWSQVHFRPDQNGVNQPAFLSHYLNTNTTFRFKQNRYGIIHSFNWDIRANDILQQRVAGYYNAQCCGFTAEWQTFDFSRLGANAVIPNDRRFHFSVTLAGIGNVSNIFGALSGTPNR